MLKREGVELTAAQSHRLYEYFNTNPSFITLIVGIFVREIKDGKTAFTTKAVYSSAFAALGDSFYWHALRPTLFMLALFVCVNISPLGIAIYPLIFSALHISLLAMGYPLGRHFGEHTILLFNRVKFSRWANIADGMSLFLLGAFIGKLLKGGYSEDLWILIAGLVAFKMGAILYRRINLNIFLWLLIVAIIAILIFWGILS
jgi:mannose/fructose/N-acetylgalactosamine-specific phosphotransferase system component IID